MADFDICILPSLCLEAGPLVVLEALTMDNLTREMSGLYEELKADRPRSQ